MLGYTIGERSIPLSAMAVASVSRVANTSKSDDSAADFQKSGSLIPATASLFVAGKISDNIGIFSQITFDPYATQSADGQFHGHSNADNIDIRFADQIIGQDSSLIFGVSANNNPSVTDPWNTTAAWMQYVPVPSPTSSRFVDGNAPYPSFGSGGNIAGVSAYAFWNRKLYAEVGGYGTSRGLFSFMSAGLSNANTTKLQGLNPYWRLTYTFDWAAHNLMLGATGMQSRVYDDPLNTADPSTLHHFRDLGVDAQYQYLLDPHTVTAQFALTANRHQMPASLANQPVAFVNANGKALANTNAQDTDHVLRMKATYTYQARYGASLGFFQLTGSADTAYLTAGYDPGSGTINQDPSATAPSVRAVDGNATGKPTMRGWTVETFWMPIQNLRFGVQYTAYGQFNGASHNYDGFGRNASDNNTLWLSVFFAF